MKDRNIPDYKLNVECQKCGRCQTKGGDCKGKKTVIPCLAFTHEISKATQAPSAMGQMYSTSNVSKEG